MEILCRKMIAEIITKIIVIKKFKKNIAPIPNSTTVEKNEGLSE